MDIYKKSRGANRLKIRQIVLLVLLSLLFILLTGVWIFLNVYTPAINIMPELSPLFGDWFMGGLLEDDIDEHMAGIVVGEMVGMERNHGDSFTFLIIGLTNDFRTNTLMFWHFNVQENKISLLSIPRDGWINIDGLYTGRVNAAFATGFNRARREGRSFDEAREDGIAFLRQVLSVTFGLQVDRYILVDLAGLRALVDAVGGVEIYVPMDMRYSDPFQNPPLHINLRRGLQTLDGNQAEQFVRFRAGYVDQDIGRIRAQQTFMAALVRDMLRFDVAQIGRIWDVATTYVTTNLSTADTAWFATRALRVSLEDIITHTLPGEPATIGAASVWSLYSAEAIAMINEYYNPFTEAIPEGNFNIFEISRRHAANANIRGTTMAELLGN